MYPSFPPNLNSSPGQAASTFAMTSSEIDSDLPRFEVQGDLFYKAIREKTGWLGVDPDHVQQVKSQGGIAIIVNGVSRQFFATVELTGKSQESKSAEKSQEGQPTEKSQEKQSIFLEFVKVDGPKRYSLPMQAPKAQLVFSL